MMSVVLHGSDHWALKEEELAKLEKNDMAMVWWTYNVTLKDKKSTEKENTKDGKHKKLHTKW